MLKLEGLSDRTRNIYEVLRFAREFDYFEYPEFDNTKEYEPDSLWGLLGYTKRPDDHRILQSDLISIIEKNKKITNVTQKEILLMSFGLLRGYEDEPKAAKRRERCIRCSDYFEHVDGKHFRQYKSCKNATEKSKLYDRAIDRLRKKEEDLIMQLVLDLELNRELSSYGKMTESDVLKELSDENLYPEPKSALKIRTSPLIEEPSEVFTSAVITDLPVGVKNLNEIGSTVKTTTDSITSQNYGVETARPALYYGTKQIEPTQSTSKTPTRPLRRGVWKWLNKTSTIIGLIASCITILGVKTTIDIFAPVNSSNSLSDAIAPLPQNSITPSDASLNFVQVSEYTTDDIESNEWQREVEVEWGRQYIIQVSICNDADESSSSTIEDIALQLSTSMSDGGFADSISIKSAITYDGIESPIVSTVLFTGSRPFNLEFIEGSAKYSCSGRTSSHPRGVSISDDVFLQEHGALLGYSELDGRLPAGEEYAGIFTVIVRVNFKTELSPGWGPDRMIYTEQNPPSHVTLNSLANHPTHGAENFFVQIKRSTESDRTYTDTMVLEPGQEYDIRIHYNNNATRSSVMDDINAAEGVKVRAAIPALVDGETHAVFYLTSNNAEPQEIWSSLVLTSINDGHIAPRIVPGSARIFNSGNINGSVLESTIVTAKGVSLGYDELDGTIPASVPGEKNYGGYVIFRIVAAQANFEVLASCRNTLDAPWTETIEAKAGQAVQCLIEYKNTGTTQQNDVVIKAKLPAGVHYVAGSGQMRNSNLPNRGSTTDDVVDEGINVGNYAPGSNALFWFNLQIDSDVVAQNGSKKLTIIARVETNNGAKEHRTRIDIVA